MDKLPINWWISSIHSADAERLSCKRVQLEGLKGFVEPASSSAQSPWKMVENAGKRMEEYGNCEFNGYLGVKRRNVLGGMGWRVVGTLTVMRPFARHQ